MEALPFAPSIGQAIQMGRQSTIFLLPNQDPDCGRLYGGKVQCDGPAAHCFYAVENLKPARAVLCCVGCEEALKASLADDVTWFRVAVVLGNGLVAGLPAAAYLPAS